MSNIAETLQNLDGVTPRVVADLQSVSYEIEHIREDIAGQYSEDDLDEAYQLIIANNVGGDDLKSLIGEGNFNAQTLLFDDVIVFFFPSERYEGVFASFDYDDDFPIKSVVEQVTEARTGEQ